MTGLVFLARPAGAWLIAANFSVTPDEWRLWLGLSLGLFGSDAGTVRLLEIKFRSRLFLPPAPFQILCAFIHLELHSGEKPDHIEPDIPQ